MLQFNKRHTILRKQLTDMHGDKHYNTEDMENFYMCIIICLLLLIN